MKRLAMSFVVMETFQAKTENYQKLKEISRHSFRIYDKIELCKEFRILCSDEHYTVMGLSTWHSKEDFNTFLKSPQMLELLNGPIMQELKEYMNSLKISTYEELKESNV